MMTMIVVRIRKMNYFPREIGGSRRATMMIRFISMSPQVYPGDGAVLI
jgi:hypothetical protein